MIRLTNNFKETAQENTVLYLNGVFACLFQLFI